MFFLFVYLFIYLFIFLCFMFFVLDESKVGHLFFLYRIVRSRIEKLASFETLVEHTIDGGIVLHNLEW